MAYDQALVNQVRVLLENQSNVNDIKMFGGLVFMVNGNMCCGVAGQELMVRVAPEHHQAFTMEPDVRPVTKGDRPMIGFLLVGGDTVKGNSGLKHWIDLALAYNQTLPSK